MKIAKRALMSSEWLADVLQRDLDGDPIAPIEKNYLDQAWQALDERYMDSAVQAYKWAALKVYTTEEIEDVTKMLQDDIAKRRANTEALDDFEAETCALIYRIAPTAENAVEYARGVRKYVETCAAVEGVSVREFLATKSRPTINKAVMKSWGRAVQKATQAVSDTATTIAQQAMSVAYGAVAIATLAKNRKIMRTLHRDAAGTVTHSIEEPMA